MSCRETSVGSAFTSWARLTAGRSLHEPATLSTFHRLRNMYSETEEGSRRTYTNEDYRGLLERQRERIAGASDLTDRQRASLISRLDAAAAEDMPDQATVYALHNLTPAVRNRARSRSVFIREIAQRTGESPSSIEERFTQASEGVTQRSAPHVTNEDRERAAQQGLSRDTGTVAAMLQLESEARHIEAAAARRAPQRITSEQIRELPPLSRITQIAGVTVQSYGYDPRNQRLEVNIHDAATGESTRLAYTNVPQELVDGPMRMDPGGTWYSQVRGAQQYQYADEDAADLDGAAPRCATCGRFADAAHACPPPATRMRRWSDAGRWTRQSVPTPYVLVDGSVREHEDGVRLPAIRRLQSAVREGPVDIDIDHDTEYPDGGVVPNPPDPDRPRWQRYDRQSGTIGVQWDDDGELQINSDRMRCTCREFQQSGRCSHLEVVESAVRDRIIRPNAQQREDNYQAARQAAVARAAERVREAADRARATDWTLEEETLREAERTWRDDSDVLYSRNAAAFVADVDEALGRAQRTGDVDIPYMTENALDGMATRESGQAFGMEIEFDVPASVDGMGRGQVLENIARELHDAGLTPVPYQEGYHASQRRGYIDTHTDASGKGTWTFERDASVSGGEIVAPGCYDEPETWQNLATVMDILKRNGAEPSTSTGMHVHVGTSGYQGSPAAYTELARMVTQHEDALYRLASDPRRGTHRSNQYSKPMKQVPPEGFADIDAARSWQMHSGGRTTTLNLGSVRGGSGDHPEFRVFDGTLDAGAAQAQIKLAVGMVNAASRQAAAGGTARGREAWGDHVRRVPDGDPNAAAGDAAGMAEGSGTVRSLLDTVFRRREDKAQLASIFAHTQWTAPKHTY